MLIKYIDEAFGTAGSILCFLVLNFSGKKGIEKCQLSVSIVGYESLEFVIFCGILD